jgi:hypothetical protein
MRWVMKFAAAGVCACGCLLGAAGAEAQCYPGLVCPDPGNQQKGNDANAGGGTSGGGAQSGAKTGVEYHYVGPVYPPDPWLALRTVPSSNGGKTLMKMPQGTLFKVTEKRGKWWYVQLRDGQSGWAHSDWIVCCKYLNE